MGWVLNGAHHNHPVMETIWNDLRHGARLLARRPWVSAVSIVTLALGIGLTTTMFSIVYAGVLGRFPFEAADRIMDVGHTAVDAPFVAPSIHDYRDYKAQQRSFDDLGAYYWTFPNVSGTERPEQFVGAAMSANMFEILRARPLMGRLFSAADEGGRSEQVVLIGETMWRNRYGSDAAIVGKSIRVNGRAATIIGVMPAAFQFPRNQQIWLPLDLDAAALPRGQGPGLEVIGRLRTGMSRQEALADLRVIAERLARDHPATNSNVRPTLDPMLQTHVSQILRGVLYTMLGAVFLVLLIACTNVASLMLSQAIVRGKEVGIRAALGASRARVTAQLLTETLLLCAAAALLGTLLSLAGIAAFNAGLHPAYDENFLAIELNAAALRFVLVLTLIVTLVAGAIPAFRASRANLTTVLEDESRGASSFRLGRLRRGLVIFEIALSCALLVAAGLATRSIINLRRLDLGFDNSNLFVATVSPSGEAYTPATLPRFYDRLHEQLAQVSGFESVALTTSLPATGGPNRRVAVEGQTYDRPQDQPEAMHLRITPSHAATLGVQVQDGRNFTAADRAGSLAVALVDRTFANRHFPGASPVGRRIRTDSPENRNDWLTIVGVLPQVLQEEVLEPRDRGVLYTPLAQDPVSTVHVLGRTRGEPLAVVNEVRTAVAAIDPDLPITSVRSLQDELRIYTSALDLFSGVFIVFGTVAFALALVGLYAVIAFSVSLRTREVGIRMALGAQARDVRRMILRQGVVQVGIGMVIGLPLAVGLSRVSTSLLYGVDVDDPVIFGSVVAALTASSLLACIIPARRASRIAPLNALR
jgi:predicted permease